MVKREIKRKSTYVAGVDFAGMGEDEAVIIIVEEDLYSRRDGSLEVAGIFTFPQTKQTDTANYLKLLHKKFNFVKIYCDYTGIGEGAVDFLKQELRNKIEGIRFTMKSKEDMYSNLKILLESGRLRLPSHRKFIMQIKDLRYEATPSGGLKIHHSDRGHDDIPDALALACLYFKPKRRYVPTIA